MPRHVFNDFLNSPGSGPSTPRGRGGSSGYRGGRGRGGTPGSGSGKKSDYSNVPFDYEAINKQSYVKLEGFSVAPYGPNHGQTPPANGHPTTPDDGRGRGVYTPRERGRGRGFPSPFRGGHNHTPPSALRSGAATPVTGLGYQKGKQVERSTVGRGGVMWGGGAAPLFVKAGELFKDGEVDVITVNSNHELHVEVVPMSDPSASQMTNLRDETEIELFDVEGMEPEEMIEQLEFEPRDEDVERSISDDGSEEDEPDRANSPILAEDDTPLFYVDTDPTPTSEPSQTTYEPMSRPSLGTSVSQDSEEETIVFKPRIYRQPEPISVQLPPAPALETTMIQPPPTMVYMDLRARSRGERKAAKRDKRGRKQKGRRQRVVIEGSDIEWGSDGPPGEIMGVEGVDDEDGEQGIGEGDDVEILRDYLEGTLLNAKAEEEEAEAEGEEVGSDDSEVKREMEKELKKQFGDDGMNGDDDEVDKENNGVKSKTRNGEDEDEGEWESSSGSSASSDVGDLKATLDVSASASEDDDEEVDLFAGKDSWDETDWFVRNMEEALGGTGLSRKGRKQGNQLFTAIENGDFDDFWPTQPAGRGKNKHVPPALQRQWEKDRQKKAEKKRHRELDRLAAELDPYPASRKKKGKNKAHQASLAHLIPASAREVADMFDITSDEESMMPPRGRMGMLPKPMEQVDMDIRSFLEMDGKNAYSLPPMDKDGRKKIHLLAECYGLKSKSKGKGRSRFTVLIKTSGVGVFIDEPKVARLLSASIVPGGKFYKALHSRHGGGVGGKGKKMPGGGGAGGWTRHREGDQVGEGAERIGGDNIGHQLLSRMGWAEGDRIGRMGGLDNPIVAIVKNTKMGLGA